MNDEVKKVPAMTGGTWALLWLLTIINGAMAVVSIHSASDAQRRVRVAATPIVELGNAILEELRGKAKEPSDADR